MPNRVFRPLLPAILAAVFAPGVASAAPLGFGDVLLHAAVAPKLIMLALAASAIAALLITGAKLARGHGLAGGSAFVSGLRFGGPIAGILGGAYGAVNMSLGLANIAYQPTLKVLAPGFAEITLLIGLGFAVGVVAVVLNWALEARIDRQVLSA